ncbi:MAG: sulfurtransferase [Betaproteobacteria bacterium]
MYTTLISAADAARHLTDPAFVFVDVRHDLARPDAWGETEYRAGHVPGAVFAHVDRDLSAPKTGMNGRHPLPSPESAAATFGSLGIDATKQVIVYDQQQGMFASRLWWTLRWLGHDAVAVLDGGFDKWKRDGLPVATDTPAVQPTSFAIRRTGPVVTTGDVVASLPARSLVIVDARSPERFRGETEPLDPVAGRIPGSINRPGSQNLAPDFTFKPAPQLRAEFERLLAGVPLDRVVHSCGSGVTACHNVLAMEVAGFPATRLYPGSWSEWVADPARPVATGPT